MNTEVIIKNNLKYWWIPLLFGAVFVVLGVWILMAPVESLKSITTVIGVIAIVSGTLQTIFTIFQRRGIPGWGFQLLGGLVDLSIGVILVLEPEILLKIVTIFVAIWLFINSITLFMRAGKTRKKGDAFWSREMIFGVILFLLALLFFWHPMALGITIAIWIAMAFIILGLFRIILTFRLRRHRIQGFDAD